jgi:peroxidase
MAKTYANDPATFQSDFAAAMVKMGSVGVLTGASGKIRGNCRVASPDDRSPDDSIS